MLFPPSSGVSSCFQAKLTVALLKEAMTAITCCRWLNPYQKLPIDLWSQWYSTVLYLSSAVHALWIKPPKLGVELPGNYINYSVFCYLLAWKTVYLFVVRKICTKSLISIQVNGHHICIWRLVVHPSLLAAGLAAPNMNVCTVYAVFAVLEVILGKHCKTKVLLLLTGSRREVCKT